VEKSIREVRSGLADVINDAISGRITYVTSHGRRVAAVVPLAIADRHIQFGGRTQDRVEALGGEELIVGTAVDDRSDVTELLDGTLELGGRLVGCGGGQGGERGEPVGVAAAGSGEQVVDVADQVGSHLRGQELGREVRQHLHVDSVGVHVSQTALIEVFEHVDRWAVR
jgi:antitoxin (DNA-binding transcriptional repressor) of toxin-antitoxin stability system